MSAPAKNPGALSGVKVLDLTLMLAGPFCTMLLADQGADVIKIEPPGGDQTRLSGPFARGDTLRSYGGYFASINRNKRSIVLDLKTEAGRDIFLRLVRDADVLIENFRTGVMDRLGVGYDRLKEINPKLVYGCLRGFGDPRSGESPYNKWPAYDVVAQAMGGIMGVTGPDAATPMKVGPGIGDTIPAMLLSNGVLGALLHAERTGEGQFVDIAMYDAMVAVCERIIYQHSYDGTVPVPEGNGHPFLCPFGLFPAKDGWVAIACPTEQFWTILAEAMGAPHIAADERYASNAARAARNDEVVALISDWTRARTKQQLADAVGGKVPFGPVNNVAEIFADPHIAARGMLAEVEHPGSDQPVVIANTPLRFSATQGGVRVRAPTLGEHRDDILEELGMGDSEIIAARDASAFGEP